MTFTRSIERRIVFSPPVLLRQGHRNRDPSFIFFANTRYACSASTCVGNVLSRFIHSFRYLSELVSLSAAYQPFVLVCRHTTAKFLPSPVTPLTCLRHAALSSVTSSEGGAFGAFAVADGGERGVAVGCLYALAPFGIPVAGIAPRCTGQPGLCDIPLRDHAPPKGSVI